MLESLRGDLSTLAQQGNATQTARKESTSVIWFRAGFRACVVVQGVLVFCCFPSGFGIVGSKMAARGNRFTSF